MTADARLLVDGHARAPVEVAATGRARARGLLGRADVEGALWLEPCRSVHTLGMRFAVDVAHVDRDGVVLATVTLAPWRLGPVHRRTRAVVEAAQGRFAAWGLRPGSRVGVTAAPASAG